MNKILVQIGIQLDSYERKKKVAEISVLKLRLRTSYGVVMDPRQDNAFFLAEGL